MNDWKCCKKGCWKYAQCKVCMNFFEVQAQDIENRWETIYVAPYVKYHIFVMYISICFWHITYLWYLYIFCLRYLGERHHGVKSCLNSGFEKLAGIVVQEKSPRNHRGKYNDGPEIKQNQPKSLQNFRHFKKIKPKDTSVDVAISASLIPTKTLFFHQR